MSPSTLTLRDVWEWQKENQRANSGKHPNRRCVDCGVVCHGRRCIDCHKKVVSAPLPPCTGCGVKLYRRRQEPIEGARLHQGHGKCHVCYDSAHRNDKNRKCDDCGAPSKGWRCVDCWRLKARSPLPPCPGCGRVVYRRRTPLEERPPNSVPAIRAGRCSPCAREVKRQQRTLQRPERPRPLPVPSPDRSPLTELELRKARCDGGTAWLFFPSAGDSDTGASEAAREICDSCPIAARCLAANLDEQYGIWGGTTPNQRKKIRQREKERRELAEARQEVGAA